MIFLEILAVLLQTPVNKKNQFQAILLFIFNGLIQFYVQHV